jgi:hypothetical protein
MAPSGCDDRSDTVETSDIVAELRRLMPGPFESRDAVAVDLLDCQDHIVSLLAGRESELLFTGQALERTGHDLDEALALATLICRSTRSVDAFIEFACTEARALLRNHADAVVVLATAFARAWYDPQRR